MKCVSKDEEVDRGHVTSRPCSNHLHYHPTMMITIPFYVLGVMKCSPQIVSLRLEGIFPCAFYGPILRQYRMKKRNAKHFNQHKWCNDGVFSHSISNSIHPLFYFLSLRVVAACDSVVPNPQPFFGSVLRHPSVFCNMWEDDFNLNLVRSNNLVSF